MKAKEVRVRLIMLLSKSAKVMFTSVMEDSSWAYWLKYRIRVSSYERSTWRSATNRLSQISWLLEQGMQLSDLDT